MQILSIAFVLVLVQAAPINGRRLNRDVPGNVNNNPMFWMIIKQLDRLETAQKQLQEKISSLESGQEKQFSKSLKKIVGVQNQLRSQIQKNKDTIKSLNSESDKQKTMVTSYRTKGPVFSGAFKNGGLLRLYSDEVIKFTAVDINRGDGYDPKTGVFTVPRPGVYIISSTLRSYNIIRFHCYLWKNNEKLAFLYGSNMNTGTVHIVRKLKKGDQLYIKHMYRGAENEAIQKGRTSMFSVAFLSDD
ncbi:hypothetical protein AM593_06908, partial [Mytilus galloprovincialis]